MSDSEIAALVEEACPCTKPAGCGSPDRQSFPHWNNCAARCRPAVEAALRKALAANDAEWKARIEAAHTGSEGSLTRSFDLGAEAMRRAILEGR